MINRPKRHVTRFFVPLIDVLILLFCVFLLMPFAVKEGVESSRLTHGQGEQLKRQMAFLEQKIAELEKTKESPEKLLERIAELEQQVKKGAADRLALRTFQVDGKDGSLSYWYTPPGGRRKLEKLKNEQKAQELIDSDLASLVGSNQELVYIILRPRERSPYPTDEQKDDYTNRWFRRVKVRWEEPEKDLGTGGGPKP